MNPSEGNCHCYYGIECSKKCDPLVYCQCQSENKFKIRKSNQHVDKDNNESLKTVDSDFDDLLSKKSKDDNEEHQQPIKGYMKKLDKRTGKVVIWHAEVLNDLQFLSMQ